MTRKLLLALYSLSALSGATLVQAEELPFFSSQTDMNSAAYQLATKDNGQQTDAVSNTNMADDQAFRAISDTRQQFAELPAQNLAVVQKYVKSDLPSSKSHLTGFGDKDHELGISFYPLENNFSFSVTVEQNPKDETDPNYNDPFHDDPNHDDPNFK